MTDDRLLFRLDQWAASSGLRDHHLGTETASSDMKAAASRIRDLEARWPGMIALSVAMENAATAFREFGDRTLESGDRIGELELLLLEAAYKLTVCVGAEYPADDCNENPDIARHRHRDAERIRRIAASLKGGDA